MPSFGLMEFLAALILPIVCAACWPPRTRAFARRGLDPGFWNLKIWLARVYFFFKGHDVVEKAYQEAKDTPYMLQTLIEDVLVLPPKYLSELRMLPGSKLSASDALVVSVLGQYSGVDVILKDRQAYDVTRLQLTKSLPSLLPAISQKADQVLSELLDVAAGSDYVQVNIQDVVANLVKRTTLMAFLGDELADNTELHELIERHANLVRDIAICLLFVPNFMRSWICSILPPCIRMRSLHRKMRQILFEESNAARRKGPFKTLLQHLIDTSETVDEADIVAKILVVSGAALHTMTMSTVHAFIDLCAYPANIAGIRSEMSRNLPSTPPWHVEDIAQLRILDAFLKESQRFNSPNYLSFDRLAMAPITLSDGTTIPRGTYICMPAGSMAMDSAFYPSPNDFAPERFHDAAKATKSNMDFISTESGNVHWGSGRFTCPGRWYASAVMKVFIALVVRKYDVKFPVGQVERLPNVYMDILVEPNPKQKILVRNRLDIA